MTEPQEWQDYVFLDVHEKEPTVPLKLLTGPYADVILCFGKVRLEEKENSKDIGVLQFTYKVLEPIEKRDVLDADQNFKEYIGRVLNSVILEAIDESGTNNPQEPNEERGVFEEDSSVSKSRVLPKS